MPKKGKGLGGLLPPDRDDWTQGEREDWLSGKKRKRGGTSASAGPVGMLPEGYIPVSRETRSAAKWNKKKKVWEY